MITRNEARKAIKEIVDTQTPIKTGITLPIKKGTIFNVHKIPIDLLIPNISNDRITWKIREYEAENNRQLDIEKEDDVEYLYTLILNDNPKANERTKEDLAKNGQQVDGVITNTGIIIDGNRRVTLLRELFKGDADKFKQNVEDFRYFNTIVLSDDIDKKQIMALETMLQIGADKKVDYNRICLYIKVDNLISAGYTYKQIKQYMNLKKDKDIEDMQETFKLMLEYLNSINKPNHFTLLDELEDQFINTKNVFRRLDNHTYNADWEYEDSDIVDFKMVCYEYMRAKFEGKKYRDVLVGKPNKTNGVFIDEYVWGNFLSNHNKIIETNKPRNEADWQLLGKNGGKLEQNLNDANHKLIDVIKDKDISKLVKEIQIKVDRIRFLLEDKTEVSEEDIEKLRKLSKDLYDVTKDYK